MFRDNLCKKTLILVAVLSLAATLLVLPASIATAGYISWIEYVSNPVIGPPTTPRAYYPCVLYDPSQFSGHGAASYYKMWFRGNSSGQYERVAFSDDGINWGSVVDTTGIAAQGYHAKVIYDAGSFGGSGYYYKIWYWDPSVSIYGITAMHTADSTDGVNWVNDQVLTQDATYPLVDGVPPHWNSGTYGPVTILYNPSATNTGDNPFNYSFAMYYDATTGGLESIGLSYSADGIHWIRYHLAPYANAAVLDHGIAGDWDSNYATHGTVIRESATVWHLWYSGGQASADDGIGYATSSDGINWTKSSRNPLLHKSDGVPWRSDRTYTPSVIYSPSDFDGHGSVNKFKMWYTGVDSSNTYQVGYAERNKIIPVGPTRFHTTIQSAIDGAYDGDTILVDAGTYNEQVFIGKDITVTSVSGAASTIIDGPDNQPYVVRVRTSGVIFDGFTVTNPGYAGGSDASGIIVTENISTSNVRISNNIVHDIGIPTRSPVVYGSVGINIGQCSDIEVDHNEVYNIKHGFVDPTHNYWAQGICIWGNGPGRIVTNINVHDNFIHDVSSPNNKDSGVGIQGDVSGIVVTNNVIQDSGEYGVDTWDDWGSAYSPTVILRNQISGASSAGIKMLYPGANPINSNTLDGCNVGILITATGEVSSIQFNNFISNTTYGLENQSVNTLDASWCYWGNPHGPSYGAISYGDSFSGNLGFRPYLDAPYGGTPPATPILITTDSTLPAGLTDVPYSVDLVAAQGIAPYTWFVYDGVLPPGLNLSADGVLSGTPTATGSYSFSLEAGDSEQADFKEFTLQIDVGQFTVNASVSGGHGTASPASQSIDYGGSASIYIEPDPGYHIASIIDNDVAVPIEDPYVIENVTADHAVVVTFTQMDVVLNKAASPAGDVVRGQVITYTLQFINNDTLPVTGAELGDFIPAYTDYVKNSTTLNGSRLQDIDGNSPLVSGLEVHSSGEAPGVVAAGAQAQVTFMVQVGNDLPLGASIRNVATAQADGIGPLEASCINNSSSELPTTWYFAEGSTQPGFDEYILLSNMGDSDMTATITYLPEGGIERSFDHLLPAHSRQTVYVNAEMPNQAGLAAIVTGSPGLICERSMYYRYQGIGGGDDTIGANAPSLDLFFAEGYTGYAESPFDEWILMLNPGFDPVNFSIDYLFPGGGSEHRQYMVPARQRLSISVDAEIGEGREVSARIRCDQPLVAERTMYFNYQDKWPGGHTGVAATGTRNDWYLAEGYTGWEGSQFDEWILVSNQNDQPSPVTVTYMFPDGSTADYNYTVAAYARLTISADSDVGEGQMISAHIHADLPVVVERAMYFDYQDKWMGGHNCLASPSPVSELYFAEGYTGNSSSQFETWLLIQNTSGEDKSALVEYLLSSGEVISQEVQLSAHSRTTIDVNRFLGTESLEFSMYVSCMDGSPTLLAERAMYFSYMGSFGASQGGHDVVGY